MAAALGKGLVFNLQHGGAGLLESAHGAHGVERVAKAGVGVHDDRNADALGDAGQGVGHFGGGGQADVGAAQPRVGNRRAGQVERFKAGLLGDQGGEGVVDPGGQQDLGLLQTLFECDGHVVPIAKKYLKNEQAKAQAAASCAAAVPAATQPPPTALSRPLPDR